MHKESYKWDKKKSVTCIFRTATNIEMSDTSQSYTVVDPKRMIISF